MRGEPGLTRRGAAVRAMLLGVALAVAAGATAGCANVRVGVRPLTTREGAGAVRLWPLLNVEPEPHQSAQLEALGAVPRTGQGVLLWPFVEWRWQQDDEGRAATFFAIHPLYSRSKFPTRATGDNYAIYHEVIYPFFQRQWKKYGDTIRTKFIFLPLWISQSKESPAPGGGGGVERRASSFGFPLWWHSEREHADPAKPDRSFSYLLPFWWRNDGLNHELPFFNPKGRTMWGLWPFYIALNSYNGWSYRTWGFPLIVWAFADDDTNRSLSLVWPFFRVQWGGEKKPLSEVRLWPLFGWQKSGDQWSAYVLWPLFIWRNADTAEKPDNSLAAYPFWLERHDGKAHYRIYFFNTGWYEDEDERARFILWPLYARWENTKEEFVEHQVFWHVFRWRTGTGEKPNTYKQLYPFYRHVELPDKSYWYRPILFWHGTHRKKAHYTFDGRYSYFFYWSKRRTFEDGYHDWSRMVFPFGVWKGDSDGTRHVRMLWLLYQEALDGAQRNWTPLWTFLTYDRDLLRRAGGPFDPVVPRTPRDLETGDDLRRTGEVVGAVEEFTLCGHLVRSYRSPRADEFQWNVGPVSYTRINGERAFSVLGGWLPLRWGAREPMEWEPPAATSDMARETDS